MNKKALSFGVVVVALVGSLLAAFIPSASATKAPHAASCVYSEYTECGYTTLTANSSVTPGTVLAKNVVVTANNGGTLTITDNGKVVTVPSGATLTLASDGTAFVNSINAKTGYGRGAITVIGGEVSTIYLHPNLGITFGPNHTDATVLNFVKFYNGAAREKVTSDLYNKPHGQLLVHLKTLTSTPTVYIKGGILEYTKGEVAIIKRAKLKKASIFMTVGTTTGKTYAFKMFVPITKLFPTVFPKK